MGWLFKSAEERALELYNKGLEAFNSGRFEDAVGHLSRGLELAPPICAAVVTMEVTGGCAYFEMWKKSKTAAHLVSAEAFFLLATGAAAAGLGREENRYAAYFNLGLCLIHQGRYKDAEPHFKRALDIRKDPETYNNIGLIFMKMNRELDAVEAWEAALKLDPKHAGACENRAKAREVYGF